MELFVGISPLVVTMICLAAVGPLRTQIITQFTYLNSRVDCPQAANDEAQEQREIACYIYCAIPALGSPLAARETLKLLFAMVSSVYLL